MGKRSLYLVAYDISDGRRLRQCLKILKRHATGGQKSVFECYLNHDEMEELLQDMIGLLDINSDRLFLLKLDNRIPVETLGIAVKPVDQNFFYVG